jgi:signal transduction histidine kinase
MRSIRRSMTIYLLALFLTTLIVVGVVIDGVTAEALRARENDGIKLFQAQFEQRCNEERKNTDEALLDQAKRLYGLIIEHDRIRWYKLTDQAFTVLRINVPEAVLVKLDPLKDKELSRFDFSQEVDKLLNPEEKNKYQEVIVTQAFLRRREEMGMYRALNDVAPLMFMTNPLSEATWTAMGNGPSTTMTMQYEMLARFTFPPNPIAQTIWISQIHTPNPTMEMLSRLYLANLLPEEYLQHISSVPNTGTLYQQVDAVAGFGRAVVTRDWPSKSLAPRKLPFDNKEIDARLPDHGRADSAGVWAYDESTIAPENEIIHRIVFRGARQVFAPQTRQGPPPGPQPGLTAGGGNVGSSPQQRPTGTVANRPDRGPPPPSLDSHLYIQCAIPKAEIEAKFVAFANERDEAREKLADDIKAARKNVLLQTVVVGLIAILAIAIGGPVIVGVGLRPVGKLSDAVSRVSERDFKLPHDGHNLVQELIPIHSRLTQTLDLLQRAFSREKQAVADISHELRTPIAALMATIDVALRKPRTPEHYRTTLEECRLISKQLGQLVERIMTLACLDAGNDRTVFSRTDAFEIASGCVAVIRGLAAQNGITVHLRQPEEMVELDTDSAKLREVLMNLLHNAVEYNRPEGTIELIFGLEKGNVFFEVRDTGIGMSPEVKDKIFERFFRADPSRHATGIHAGLGLAIVKEYVTRLNGTIHVESEPGVGTTFRIVLPGLPAEPDPDPHPVEHAASIQ